jgi:hypothetical protein
MPEEAVVGWVLWNSTRERCTREKAVGVKVKWVQTWEETGALNLEQRVKRS